jgi:hypothetical protein
MISVHKTIVLFLNQSQNTNFGTLLAKMAEIEAQAAQSQNE